MKSSAVRPRWVFAAAHVVMRDGYASVDHDPARPGDAEEIAAWIDWDDTMALRRRLDRLGFGIAEAMDTAQRFELGWTGAARLIRECGALALRHGFVAGAGVDQCAQLTSETAVIDAVCEQIDFIQRHGGIAIVLPIEWLPRHAADAECYVRVYSAIIDASSGPLLLHWLGEMFAPALRGYFPGDSFERILAHDPAKVRGCKLSLLDAAFEREVRRRATPREQVVLTGDDFHFAEMLRGDDQTVRAHTRIGAHEVRLGDFSHGLLGIFDAIALPAARALEALALGDLATFDAIMAPCEELGRHVFAPPTPHYKTGLAHLAWLGGLQRNPMLVNHRERCRDRAHLLRAIELAERAGLLGKAHAARIAQFRQRDDASTSP